MTRLPEGAAWVSLAAVLCLGALAVAGIGPAAPATPAGGLDWRPGLAGLAQPWRLWTCAWVHWSTPHLLVNLLGGVVVGAVGWRACASSAAALAWFIAWPLTHLLMEVPQALELSPTLQRYGGLSGVLHAGVIVLGLDLAGPAQTARHRWIGLAILAGTVLKSLSETPWNPSLRPNAMLGIHVAPVAHACAIAAGALAWALVAIARRGLARKGGRATTH